jgi:hypothetical protein
VISSPSGFRRRVSPPLFARSDGAAEREEFFAVRFTRISPAGIDDLRQGIIADPEALSSGMRVVATSIPVAGRGVIDLLAADQRGRLALVSIHLEARHDAVGGAVALWDWTAAHLPLLRALVPSGGLDLTQEPRLIVAAARADETARRMAAYVTRPEIEIIEITLVAAGEHRGILADRVAVSAPPSAAPQAYQDPVPATVPAGAPRSFMRRVLEEIRDVRVEGRPLQIAGVDGEVDLLVDGRAVAAVLATRAGVEVRQLEGAAIRRIESDQDCREAVEFILDAALRGAGRPRDGSPRQAAHAAPAAAALTPEEIAELAKLSSPPEAAVERASETPGAPRDPAAVSVDRPRLVEN